MKPGEWEGATGITGLTRVATIYQAGVHGCGCVLTIPERALIHNIANHQSKFWITYDDDNLYIAHHSPPPPEIADNPAFIEVMLKQKATLRDSNINNDDCISIEIESPVFPEGDNYVIQINSIGTTFECIWGGEKGVLPGITIGWDPEIINESTLTPQGWFIETSIPWEELEPNISKPQPGETMNMNFGRIWREMMNEYHAWQGYDQYRPKGEVVFMGDEGIVVKLKDTGNFSRGNVLFEADINNRYSQEREITAEVAADSGEIYEKEYITLAPGETVHYNFDAVTSNPATTAISLTLTDTATGNPVHITTLPVIRPIEPEFFIRRYRSRELSRIEIDMSFIGQADPARTSIAFTITDKETGRRVFRRTYRGFSSYQPSLEFSTKDLKPGDYKASFIFSAPGMARYETTIDYRHPELPAWWQNRYGFEDVENDVVPYPWTDMQVEEDILKVWGRTYDFGGILLPRQVTVLGQPVLRKPMRLIAETKDGEVLDSSLLDAESEWTLTNRTRVEAIRNLQGGNISLSNSLWAEYDGFILSTLKVKALKGAVISSLVLEIPVNKAFTDVINTSDYSLRGTGKIGEEGYAASAFSPLWLGNGDGGIQFLSLEDNRFFVKDPQKVVRVRVDGGEATILINLIDVPSSFQEHYEFSFGFIATPVRPKINRTPFFSRVSILGGGAFYPDGMMCVPAVDLGRDFYGYGQKAGRIYVFPGSLNVCPEAMKNDVEGGQDYLFADEFRANSTDRSLDRISSDFRSQESRDYFVWRHWNYQRKYGFRGLYYDGMIGQTVLGAREIMKRLYNIALSNQHYSAREANIGIHTSALINMGAFGFGNFNWDAENYNSIINHNQQTYKGFTDPGVYRAIHMGHNFGWPLYFLGQGRIRRDWVESNGGPERVFDQISGLDLLHDGIGVCCIMPAIEGAKPQEMRRVRKRMSDALERHNFYHWKYQFSPYWKQDILKMPFDGMYASLYVARPSLIAGVMQSNPEARVAGVQNYFDMYRHFPLYIQAKIREEIFMGPETPYIETLQDKAIFIVYNDTDREGEMSLEVDWNKLGLGVPETLSTENAVHSTGFRLEKKTNEQGAAYEEAVFFDRPDEYARIEGGRLIFPITGHNYRMIVITQK